MPVTGWRRGRDRRRARYVAAMPRAFPIIHVGDVARTAEFYAQLLGFVEDVRNPPPARARRPTSACSLTIPESALSVPIGRAHAGHPAGFRSPVRAVCVRRRRLQPGRCRGGRSAARTRDDALGERIAYVADAEGNPSRLPPPTRHGHRFGRCLRIGISLRAREEAAANPATDGRCTKLVPEPI